MLRLRKSLEQMTQRYAQLMQAGISQLHLRLYAHRLHDRHIWRRRDQIPEQGCLPNPSIPTQNKRAALAPADG
jgi:hypothetical protein